MLRGLAIRETFQKIADCRSAELKKMEPTSVIGTSLLIITGLISYKGFRDQVFLDTHIFHVDKILMHKEYGRLLSSGFLHAGWLHLGFNMIALLAFSLSLEIELGLWNFILLYFASLIGGSFLALFIHRNHGDYRALGASGAISGVVLAAVILMPDSKIGFILIPFEMPAWIFGVLFVLVSIFGIKSQGDNIGHEAHLGGAIIGMICMFALRPIEIWENKGIFLALLLPSLLFLFLVIKNPKVLMLQNYWGETAHSLKETIKNTSSKKKTLINPETELNQLLDKIKKSGIDSLSKKEKKRLEELSK